MIDPLNQADPSNVFLTEKQVEQDRWGGKKGYLAELRGRGEGPEYVRLSPRMLRYRLSAVLDYEDTHTFTSTAAELVAQGESPAPPQALPDPKKRPRESTLNRNALE
jgi:hypothetical protein